MTGKDIPWMRLDASKADYGAIRGAYVNGITLLLCPDTSGGHFVVVVGVCSCLSTAEAEGIARGTTERGDRRVSRATLLGWKA